MEDKDFQIILQTIENCIDKKVNGKIDKLHEKLDEEIVRNKNQREKMQPVYDAYNAAHKTGDFIIWLSKVIIAIGMVIASMIASIKFLGK